MLATPGLLALPSLSFADPRDTTLQNSLAALEQQHGGRLGVAMLDTANNRLIAHRGNERFPLCSVHKLFSASFVLARVDRGQESLSRRIVYPESELIEYSPFTEKHTGKPGATLGELCGAAVSLSDNTAANLLLRSFGGPPALTAYLRSLGDPVTRLDRYEPEMNDVGPGDPRDTTTPVAMLRDMQTLLLGNALSPAMRQQLTAWMLANQTGGHRLRAGLPRNWRVGDKTGTGPAINNSVNDAAILWSPHRAPILVTAFYAFSREPDTQREAVLAEVGRLVAQSFNGHKSTTASRLAPPAVGPILAAPTFGSDSV
jgi:beta-lactamase class A